MILRLWHALQWERAISALAKKDNARAVDLLGRVKLRGGAALTARLQYGLALQRLGQTEAAIAALVDVIRRESAKDPKERSASSRYREAYAKLYLHVAQREHRANPERTMELYDDLLSVTVNEDLRTRYLPLPTRQSLM